MIRIVAKALVKEECVSDFTAIAKKLVEASQKENGNISYSLNVSTENPRLFCFIEIWESPQILAAHSKSAHFLEAMRNIKPMTEGRMAIEMFKEV